MSGDHDHDGPGDGQPRGDSDNWPALDVDAAFAAIVANYSWQEPAVGPWPAAEDLDQDDAPPSGDPPPATPARPGSSTPGSSTPGSTPESSTPAAAASTAGTAPQPSLPEAEDEEEGFVPPDPPPLPHGDLLTRASWAAVIGGPLFLLIAALAWRDLPTWLLLAALTAFIGGFVTLVARMPGERPDDPDDGAVV